MSDTSTTQSLLTATPAPQAMTLEAFKKVLHAYQQAFKEAQDRSTLHDLLVTFLKEDLPKNFVALGNDLVALHATAGDEATHHTALYLVTYVCPQHVKNLAILYRDVLLELNKNAVYEHDYAFSQEKLLTHVHASQNMLVQATQNTLKHISEQEQLLQLKKNKQDVVTRSINAVVSPWSTYQKQLLMITEQVALILQAHGQILNAYDHFKELKEVFQRIDLQFKSLLNLYRETIQTLSDKIANREEQATTYGIHQALERAAKMGNVQRSVQLNEDIRAITAKLELKKIPLKGQGGILVFKELQLATTVQKWLDYELFPLLADFYALEENLKLKIHLKLSNLQKLLTLNKESPIFELSRIFSVIEDELSHAAQRAQEIHGAMQQKLESELQVRAFYQEQRFLNMPLNRFDDSSQHDIITSAVLRFKKALNFVQSWYKKNTYVNNRTALQETTMCIADRMRFTELGHYDSLFINRNFIGDLFYVVRKEAEAEFIRAVEEWQLAFAKAILITGTSSSGKSTFLQQTVKRVIKNKVIHLQPHSAITIDGRKYTTTACLVSALEHIKKSSQIHRSRPVLSIDGLEFWQDYEHPLLDNVRALLRFIEEDSQEVLVLVTCSSIFRQHMNHRFGFDDHFTNIIDLSRCGTKEIVKAVSVRHETAHKTLVNTQNVVLTTAKREKEIRTLAAGVSNNIGAVMQSWAFHTKLLGDDRVQFVPSEHDVVPFFNDIEVSILKHVVIYKHTSERILKRITATAYELKYKSALRRLINLKILQRNLEGNLHLNPVIVHEVEQLIIKKYKS